MMIRNKQFKADKIRAGRLGGLARVALHGNPGTSAGRRRGGLASLKTHRKLKTGFKLLAKIKTPRPSGDLAEFIGIMLGDGHVDAYQATITTNAETDYAHAQYVGKLVTRLFGVVPGFSLSKKRKACTVVISSRALCDFLQQQGLPNGNKITDGVRIPQWIRDNPTFLNQCIRGLFDTDGCVFNDRHTIAGKVYLNIGIAFSNRNSAILSLFKNGLLSMGLHPTQSNSFAVFLRRSAEVDAYFRTIGSSNQKHLGRYEQFRRR